VQTCIWDIDGLRLSGLHLVRPERKEFFMVLPVKDTIIYGPVNSRRLGKSLGINLLPHRKKYCDFDCLYCHYGRTRYHRLKPLESDIFPGVETVLQKVEEALKSEIEFNYLTFSGNGEPTLHPEFKKLAYECHRLARQIRPRVKVTLLSNSSTCTSGKVIEATEYIDLPIMKLDAGNAELFGKINKPAAGIDFDEIVEGLSCLKDITIQTLFLAGDPDNSTIDAVNDWYSCLYRIKPVDVQIYTLDRPFAGMAENGRVNIDKVNNNRMEEIAKIGRLQYGLNISRY